MTLKELTLKAERLQREYRSATRAHKDELWSQYVKVRRKIVILNREASEARQGR